MAIHDALTNSPSDGAAHQIHSPGYSVADVSTMNSISTGSAGDLCFVQSSGSYYAYTGSVWLPLNIGINRSGSTTDAHLAVWNGSNADSLKDGGTAPSAGALVLLEQHTASNTVTLDFTSFSATYDEYMLEIVNLIPATNSVAFDMRMGTGAGPTFDTGANYGWMAFTWRAGASAVTGADSGADRIQLGFNTTIENTANFAVYGQLRLFAPGSSIYKTVEGKVNFLASSLRIGNVVDGIYRSTTAVTGVQFFFSSGSAASGTIRCYGIAK